MRVAVVGAGLMGAQIACEYALGGYPVLALARDGDRLQQRIEVALELLREHGLRTPEQIDRASGLIELRAGDATVEHMDLGVKIDLLVESLPEDLELKARGLRALASSQPEALIATNTSSISIRTLTEAAGLRGRLIATHYWNPPLLMPLVEVLAADGTPERARDRVVEMLLKIGKRPVLLNREVPGLLWNRLQAALLREALWLVEQGVATPAAVDEVVRDGLARRMRLTGPFETVALGGVATFEAIAANLFPTLSDAESAVSLGTHLPVDPAQLAALRKSRERALARELLEEREGAHRRKD